MQEWQGEKGNSSGKLGPRKIVDCGVNRLPQELRNVRNAKMA
jgi:hypothetical protein